MLDVGINAAPLAAQRTGVGRYIAGLLDALEALRPQGLRARPLFLPGPAERGLRGLVKRLPFAYTLAEASRAVLLERERRRGLSVYHETNHAAPAFRGPVVLTVHDLSTVLQPQTQEPARVRHFSRALVARARNASRVIVPTEAIAREVCDHLGVKRDRLRVIHHGVDSRFTPGLEARGRFVLYTGDDGPRKGLATLRAAVPDGVTLKMAGPGHGYVGDDELLRLYRTAALFVLPSLYEGFGLPLLEAMASGAPCIASDDPALLEVSAGAALHFPRGDAAALRSCIEQVLADASLRADLSRKGIARARIPLGRLRAQARGGVPRGGGLVRVALVHDWLTGLRGGERVLEQLCVLYPRACIFTLVHIRGSCGPIIEQHQIVTSFLDKLPKRVYRHYLPLFPVAIESLDLRGFDLVISTSHAVAKGCRPAEGAAHVAYVHTPMRYVWDQFDAYFGKGRAGPFTRLAAHAVAPYLRHWDVRSTSRVNGIIANSRFVAGRIRGVWGREADAVVYPPVDTARFVPAAEGPADYALIVSALVPYKRIELAVSAFSRLKKSLWIAGDGPELARLRDAAGPSVRFLGAVSGDALPGLYARAKYFVLPGEEDFGIAPVEAQAAGRPVLALGRGGALETVIDGETGVFFPEPTVQSLVDGISRIERLQTDPMRLRRHAAQFDVARFGPEVKRAIDGVLTRLRQ